MEIYFETEQLHLQKYFKDKDRISLDDILDLIDNLQYEKEHLEEELYDLNNELQNNYKPISCEDMYI